MTEHEFIDPADLEMELTQCDDCNRRIVISVPARHAKRFQKKLKKSGQDASDEVTTTQLSNFCVEQSLLRFEITPIWGPVQTPGTERTAYRPERDFLMSIDVDHSPTIQWPDFTTLTITRPIREITDELIDNEMIEQRRDAGTRSPLENQIQTDDEVICHVALCERGSDTPIYEQPNAAIRVPAISGTAKVFDLDVAELGDKIIGRSVGDAVIVEATAPDDYFDHSLQGVDITISLTISQASRVELASAQEIVDQYGSPSEAILRQQIRLALDAKATQDQREILSQQVLEQLTDQQDIPVPSRVIQNFRDSLATAWIAAMKQRGCSEDTVASRLQDQEDHLTQQAMKIAQKRAACNLLGKHFGISVGEDAVIGQIAEIASEQGRRPEDVRQELVQAGRLQSVMLIALERLVVERVLEVATVTDMPADEWIATRSNATA